MAQAGLVACLLDGHSEVDDVHDDLGVSLGLEVSAHDPKGHNGVSVARHECGDDGMEGALVGLEAIAVIGIERIGLAAILDGESEAVGADGGAETAVEALDE